MGEVVVFSTNHARTTEYPSLNEKNRPLHIIHKNSLTHKLNYENKIIKHLKNM